MEEQFGYSLPRSFQSDLIALEKAQKAILCEISKKLTETTPSDQTGVDCEGNPIVIPSSILITPAPGAVQLVKICSSEIKDPEIVCISNDGGETIVSGWEVFTVTDAGVVSSKLYLGGVDVTSTYQVVPCGVKTKYDYEIQSTCVDGLQWKEVLVFNPSGPVPTLITSLWLNEYSLPVLAPDVNLINNTNCKEKFTPSISDAYADDLSTLLEGNSFTITKPDCCNIKIETTIGTFNLRAKETYYSTEKYDVAFEILSVTITSGNCTLNQIHIISNKTK